MAGRKCGTGVEDTFRLLPSTCLGLAMVLLTLPSAEEKGPLRRICWS